MATMVSAPTEDQDERIALWDKANIVIRKLLEQVWDIIDNVENLPCYIVAMDIELRHLNSENGRWPDWERICNADVQRQPDHPWLTKCQTHRSMPVKSALKPSIHKSARAESPATATQTIDVRSSTTSKTPSNVVSTAAKMSGPSIADNKDSSRDVILLDDKDDEDPPHGKKKQVKKVQDEPKNNALDISVYKDDKWEGRGRSHHRKGHHNMGSDPKEKGKVKAGDMMVKTTSQVLHPLHPSRHNADDRRRDPSSLPSIRITLPSAISCAPARVNVAPKTPIASLQCDTCTSKNQKCIPVPGQACCSCHDSRIKCNFTRKHGCWKSKVAGSSQSGTNTDTTQLDADNNADEGSERSESPSPPLKARRMSPPGVSTWSKSRARTAPIA
ncbi:hypothetical protein V8E55_002676 [Tylopilus felleus]